MYRKHGFFLKDKTFTARIITFATNNWHFIYVSRLFSGAALFTTQLGLQMFNLTEDFNENSCQDVVRCFENHWKRYVCCNSCDMMSYIEYGSCFETITTVLIVDG